jgi:hypothetical protein
LYTRYVHMAAVEGQTPLAAYLPTNYCEDSSGWSGSATAAGFLPNQLATMGVSATVGGNRTGDSALCAAYASATVPIHVHSHLQSTTPLIPLSLTPS